MAIASLLRRSTLVSLSVKIIETPLPRPPAVAAGMLLPAIFNFDETGAIRLVQAAGLEPAQLFRADGLGPVGFRAVQRAQLRRSTDIAGRTTNR